ncbi:hypothetical protein ASPFODRAFT_42884 [Aspergillus luchuensis CBS 106.47]|uniref:Uncharacterized protein n=1 Tax=Aspergillus luchuensis (strain CBS 106.47) TaxID=1137211 RepID=A0A1M3TS04_ASPLC|nr:hypothetical protein ASPFODRAFT_42884 [Aspergillus luchuensis CBS 106.47]
MARLAPVMFRCALTFEHSIGGSPPSASHAFIPFSFSGLGGKKKVTLWIFSLPGTVSGPKRNYDRIGGLHLVVFNARTVGWLVGRPE